MWRSGLLLLILVLTAPALAQEKRSCESQKRQALAHSDVLFRSRNKLEADLAYVVSQLSLLRDRYATLKKVVAVTKAKRAKEAVEEKELE